MTSRGRVADPFGFDEQVGTGRHLAVQVGAEPARRRSKLRGEVALAQTRAREHGFESGHDFFLCVHREVAPRAHEKGIPVVRHVWLARTLYATAKERKAIPRALFDPVALLYSVAEQLQAQGGGYVELDDAQGQPGLA